MPSPTPPRLNLNDLTRMLGAFGASAANMGLSFRDLAERMGTLEQQMGVIHDAREAEHVNATILQSAEFVTDVFHRLGVCVDRLSMQQALDQLQQLADQLKPLSESPHAKENLRQLANAMIEDIAHRRAEPLCFLELEP